MKSDRLQFVIHAFHRLAPRGASGLKYLHQLRHGVLLCLAPRGASGLKYGLSPPLKLNLRLAPRGASGLKLDTVFDSLCGQCVWLREELVD